MFSRLGFLLFIVTSSITLCRAVGHEQSYWRYDPHASPSPPIERDFLSSFGGTTEGASSSSPYHVDDSIEDVGSSTSGIYGDIPMYDGGAAMQHLNLYGIQHQPQPVHALGRQDVAPMQHYDLAHQYQLGLYNQQQADMQMSVNGEEQEQQSRRVSQGADGRQRRRPSEEEITGVSYDAYWNPRGSSQIDLVKAHVGLLCRRKGLWVGMPPREMAAGLAEIKVEIGSEAANTIGPIAAIYIKRSPLSNDKYIMEQREWGKKFVKNVHRLSRKHPELAEQQKTYLLAGLRFLQDRQAYRENLASTLFRGKDREEQRLNTEALRAWEAMESAFGGGSAGGHFNRNEGVRPVSREIPLDVVERVSRSITTLFPSHSPSYQVVLEPYSPAEVADLLRRYMLTALGKDQSEVDIFNKHRNDWLKINHFAALNAGS